MKLISWNVNGVRAVMRKGADSIIKELDTDILCLQETKAQDDQVAEALVSIKGYHLFSNSAVRKGYSGTAILTREKPLNVVPDIGIEIHDQEGRVLAAEYDDFWFVNVYVPNAGQGLARLDYRESWDKAFLMYLQKLEKSKPVIVAGDFNVAHQEIDIARPKSNYNKTAGYTQTEIDGMSSFLKSSFTDTFRTLYPEDVAYSWWSWRGNARASNIGWRIDYFLVSQGFMHNVKDAFIKPEIEGSDHCPVGILI